MTETIKVLSVNTLESLVPPVDLCSKIPDGIFADSALIWCYDGDFWHVEARATSFYNKEEDIRPAPTLQEILVTMKHLSISLGFSIHPLDWRWYIYANNQKSNDGTRIRKEDHNNPATAALKLYLNLLSDPSDPSVPSVKSVNPPEAQP